MMAQTRRSLLTTLGSMLPFGIAAGAVASPADPAVPPTLQFRSFEEGVRLAFAAATGPGCHRVEVGPSDLIQMGVQGCHNSRPFAGFPAGHLRIVRAGSEPGAHRHGVRLYVTTVDVTATSGLDRDTASRPLDFAMLPAAPYFA